LWEKDGRKNALNDKAYLDEFMSAVEMPNFSGLFFAEFISTVGYGPTGGPMAGIIQGSRPELWYPQFQDGDEYGPERPWTKVTE
jgi:hypothetical protein